MTDSDAGGSTASILVPRKVQAPALRAGHVVRFFEYLTVPHEMLGAWQKRQRNQKPSPAVQWRCEYLPPSNPNIPTERERCALAVLEKIIHRGRITQLSPTLEAALRNVAATRGRVCDVAVNLAEIDATASDSEVERIFWQVRLPELVGLDCWRWVTPQVGLECLGVPESANRQERVDFVVCHPALATPVVIEIDGPHHGESGRKTKDAVRDGRLTKAGIHVARIPAHEVVHPSGRFTELQELLAPVKDRPIPDGVFRDPCRRAGQIQLVLLEALRAGLVSPEAIQNVRVETDAVTFGDVCPNQLALILDDFRQLVAEVSELYGLAWGVYSTGTVQSADGQADLLISFYGDSINSNVIHVNDVVLPFHFDHKPFCSGPARLDTPSVETLRFFLNRIFRKDDFRDGQYAAIVRALAGRDTLVLLPTGSGKSLVFQLASFLLPGSTFVIEPIVALIRDQVVNLAKEGIDRALGITADTGGAEAKEAAYARVGSAQDLFYYVSPERFQMEAFREAVRSGTSAGVPAALIVMDEAHCVSDWGHDFRTSYLRVADTVRDCATYGGKTPPLIGLTGTASQAVLKDVQRELKLLGRESVLTPSSFDRPELQFIVRACDSQNKRGVLKELMTQTLPTLFGTSPVELTAREPSPCKCGLIFCLHTVGPYGVKSVHRDLVGSIRARNADYYCGRNPNKPQMTDDDWRKHKLRVEEKFKKDDLTILACTKAYGMGIDKENIRYTIHYGIPGSIEAFYQEAGRAGRKRDMNEPAYCSVIASLDTETMYDRLLPGLPSASASEEHQEEEEGRTRRYRKDDVDRLMRFHVESFPGVACELQSISDCLAQLHSIDKTARRSIRYEDDESMDRLEKSIHRLSVLGVIEDYSVDFSSRHFDVRLAGASPRDVGDAYLHYVAGYSALDASLAKTETEPLIASAGPRLTPNFVSSVAEPFLEFVYGQIERGRRWAMWNMAQACLESVGDPEELRRRILAYLQVTEYAERMEQALQDEAGGLETINDVIRITNSPEKAEELRGQAGRFLESYPDHPAIRFARAAAELLCNRGSVVVAREHLILAVEIARERYHIDDTSIGKSCGLMLKKVWDMNRGRATELERALLEEYGSPEFARQLLEFGSVDACDLSAWYLLRPLAEESIELCRR